MKSGLQKRARALFSTPVSSSKVLSHCFTQETRPQRRRSASLPLGLPSVGNVHTAAVWGFPPPSGEAHIVSDLCFLSRTGAPQMTSRPVCPKLRSAPGGDKLAGACTEGEERFGTVRRSASSLLATANSVSYSNH